VYEVADVADAAGGGETDGQVQCLPPGGRCLLGSATIGETGGVVVVVLGVPVFFGPRCIK